MPTNSTYTMRSAMVSIGGQFYTYLSRRIRAHSRIRVFVCIHVTKRLTRCFHARSFGTRIPWRTYALRGVGSFSIKISK